MDRDRHSNLSRRSEEEEEEEKENTSNLLGIVTGPTPQTKSKEKRGSLLLDKNKASRKLFIFLNKKPRECFL